MFGNQLRVPGVRLIIANIKDRNVIEKLLTALQNKVQAGRKLFEDTLHNNRQRADELARKQRALREWIDQQTTAEPAANTLGATP